MKRLGFGLIVFLLALAAGANIFLGHAMAAPAAATAQASIDVDGRITVEVAGKAGAPDIVLIPGLTSSRAVWDGTVKQLGGRYRLHLVQINGFAGMPAGANASGPVLQPVVDAVDAYIKAAHLKSPAVIGHSLGGLAGLMLAEQHPEDVGRLLVVDSLPFFGLLFGPQTTVEMVTGQGGMMRDRMAAATDDQYAAMETQAIASLAKDPEGRKLATAWAIASDRKVVAQAFYDDLTTDVRPGLPALKLPVTVLYPFDESAGRPAAMIDGLYTGAYAGLPGVKMQRIDGSYHFIMLDQPAAFAAAVEGFLK